MLNRKSILLWRSTVFGWTARMMRSSRSVLLSPPARWTARRCWSGCECTVFDPLLTQNAKKAGRAGRKQRKTRRTNGGKKHKSEPKRLRFFFGTTYGPEGRGFESLTACHPETVATQRLRGFLMPFGGGERTPMSFKCLSDSLRVCRPFLACAMQRRTFAHRLLPLHKLFLLQYAAQRQRQCDVAGKCQ